MSKKSVAVVMGGFSDEYEVSLKSGQLIFDSLDRSLYEVYKVHILKEGWFFVDENGQRYPIDKSDFSATLPSGASIKFDVCFNTIHGTPGENGLMQGYWDMIGQRYTGCSFYASALTFNKKDTLAVLSKYDIPSAKSVYIRRGDCYNEDDIVKELGLPLFVKPNQSGSSLGASKVNEKTELNAAIERAFEQDDDVLIEAFLEGTEVSVGVLDYQGETIVLGITEIVSENEFFDFDAKYNGESQEITPARLDDSTKEKVECIAKRAYKALNMSGFSRSEFIIIDGVPYMLEMNTNPGFSPASILPQQAGIYGISIKDLCGNEVEKALAKNNKH